ncbi:MAG: hypothetical protein WC460_05325 [Patescibacteria group bacterium]
MKKIWEFVIKEQNKIFIGLFFILGLLVFHWFKNESFISGGSFYWPLNFLDYFKDTIAGWRTAELFGSHNLRQYAYLFPFVIAGIPFFAIFNSSLIYEIFFFYICFVFSGLSAYLLLRRYKLDNLVCFVAAIFYMFSPFALITVWYLSIGFYFPFYAFLPLFTLLFLDYVEGKRNLAITLILIFITPLATTFGNPAFLLLIAALAFIYVLTNLIVNRQGLLNIFKKTVWFFIFFLLLNSFWLLPFVLDLNNQYVSADNVSGLNTIDDKENIALNSFSNLENWRNFGLWSFHAETNKDYYYPWHENYRKTGFILLSFITAIALLFSLFYKEKNNFKDKTFWLITFLIFFTLNVFSSSPLKDALFFIYDKFPFLERAFRAGGTKYGFIYTLAFAVLLAFGLQFLRRKIKSFILLFLIPIFIVSYPFITGDVIYKGGKYLQEYYAQVPAEYKMLRNFLHQQDLIGRSLVFPTASFYNYYNNWKSGYAGSDYIKEIAADEIISISDQRLVPLIYLFAKIDKTTLTKMLDLLNIGQVIFRSDYDNNGKFYSFDESLVSFPENKKIYEDNIFQVFQREQYLPRFYVPEKIFLADGDYQNLPFILSNKNFDNQSAVIFMDENPKNSASAKLEQNTIINSREIEIKTISPNETLSKQIEIYKQVFSQKEFKWQSLNSRKYIAKSYPGWKNIIRLDGQNKDSILSFNNPQSAPYTFPSFSREAWNAKDSSLIYLKTGNTELAINGFILSNSQERKLIRPVHVFWDTGWYGMETKPMPQIIKIPAQQKVIFQIDSLIDSNAQIELSYDTNLSWQDLKPDTFLIKNNINQWAYVINCQQGDEFLRLGKKDASCPYEKLLKKYSSTQFNVFNGLLVYLQNGSKETIIKGFTSNGQEVKPVAVFGSFLPDGYLGLDKEISYPITIPADEKLIAYLTDAKDLEPLVNIVTDNFICQSNKFSAQNNSQEIFAYNYLDDQETLLPHKLGQCNLENASYTYLEINNKSSEVINLKNLLSEKRDDQPIIFASCDNNVYSSKEVNNGFLIPAGSKGTVVVKNNLDDKLFLNTYEIASSNKIKHLPQYNFERISGTKYQVKISGAADDFLLVFSEKFNPGWKASPRGMQANKLKEWFENNILAEKDHFLANGYANSWWLEIEKICQKPNQCVKNADNTYNFELMIEFQPKQWFYFGLLISGTTLAGCLGYLAYVKIKSLRLKRKNKKIKTA